ncbi:cation:proton antiporter [Streptomyces sp. NPDC101455]|uniref:cation:proton antiporter domain-containing protein n=1 Tax=Streptomyces sp. NPDC101455 TaxID=3366142 RepID=UPI00380E0B59
MLIVVLAAAISFIPALPRLELDADVILGIVVPPLLYAAALDFSVVAFARNLRPVLALGVGLVAVTTLVTGFLARALLPALTAGSAVVLASVISPPGTVTATTHGRAMGLPHRAVTILTGESLINDAAALAVFTTATTAVTGEHTLIDGPVLLFAYAAIAGIVLRARIQPAPPPAGSGPAPRTPTSPRPSTWPCPSPPTSWPSS